MGRLPRLLAVALVALLVAACNAIPITVPNPNAQSDAEHFAEDSGHGGPGDSGITDSTKQELDGPMSAGFDSSPSDSSPSDSAAPDAGALDGLPADGSPSEAGPDGLVSDTAVDATTQDLALVD